MPVVYIHSPFPEAVVQKNVYFVHIAEFAVVPAKLSTMRIRHEH